MGPRKPLGAVTDDPRHIMATAIEELRNAERETDRIAALAPGTRIEDVSRAAQLRFRQAAEKAHLALSSAVERASRRTITTYGEEMDALEIIGKRGGEETNIVADYKELRKTLHSDCFHQDRCGTPAALGVEMGKAEFLMETILRTKSPKRSR